MKKISFFLLVIFSYLADNVTPIFAQIRPDSTLPNNSVVISNGNRLRIEGGTSLGINLFHSFKEFSLPTGKEVFFNNSSSIENIISRVTGDSISYIDGLIQANGTANLFFLNPNGIIFDRNATLNIGGSFVASTASSLKFADGGNFNTVENQKSILTVSVPIGLDFRGVSGAIQVRGEGYNIVEIPPFNPFLVGEHQGLNIASGKTLALVGSNIVLEGGILTAASGRIELGSVEQGTILFQQFPQGMKLDYSNAIFFKDIQINSLALVDASGLVGGSIQIYGKQINIDSGGLVLIRNLGQQLSGDIFVNAQDSLKITGDVINSNSSSPFAVGRSSITTESLTEGKGGNINVFSPNLIIQEGGAIGTRGFGNASTGNINIQTTQSLNILNFSPINPRFFSGIIAVTNGQGDAGDINIFSKNILAANGGEITSSNLGEGNGGNVNVNVQDSIILIGAFERVFIPSLIVAATLGSGEGGSLTINTAKLFVQDGARIDTSSYNTGRAGNITITASDFIEVSGGISNFDNTTSISSSVIRAEPIVQELLQLPQTPTGTSGSITVNTPLLMIKDNGLVTVRNTGIGNAGNLIINSSAIVLKNFAGINAATLLGDGGNIFINSSNIRLFDYSGISATAGGMGDGGNIALDTDTLITLGNSNISANALDGRGGNISIDARGVFTNLSFEETFNVSSELGIDGTITLNTPETDIQKDLEQLTSPLISLEQVLAKSCITQRNSRTGSFVSTGNGGLPTTPDVAIDDFAPNEDMKPTRENSNSQSVVPKISDRNFSPGELDSPDNIYISSVAPWQPGEPMIRGQVLLKTDDGRLLWVAKPSSEKVKSVQELVCY